jgi:hypothetical protein
MSTGFPWDQCGGSAASRTFSVSDARRASGTPFASALSAAMTPGPPPLVTMASREPCGIRRAARMRAAAKSCV